ncbi:MAG: fimbrillin family protein [Clostridiales bacterium]|jgi:hypothetical protein|nr:fimbrillin family protein [Clostridiales bacterium]
MKNKKNLAMAALAAVAILTSCSKDKDNEVSKPVEIRLSSAVTPQTRGAHTEMDVQIPANQTVAVYVDKADDTPLYGKTVLTANGSGGFTGTALYFPQSGDDVNIYAFHTNTDLGANYPTGELTHTVQTYQGSQTSYAASDLLYAKTTNVGKTSSTVTLGFYHLLSKVRIAVRFGAELGDVSDESLGILDSGMTIENTKLGATFLPDKTIAANAVAITATGDVTPILVTNLNSSEISTDFSTGVKYHDAIVVPQTLREGDKFISIEVYGGSVPELIGTLDYELPGDITFESGKVYTYHITVGRTGLTVHSSITDWDDSPGTVEGRVTL